MEIEEIFSSEDGKPISFGPLSVGYSTKRKRPSSEPWLFFYRVFNKLYLAPLQRKKYVNLIAHAFRVGYRIIDYSCAYGDGILLGKAIRKSGVKREDLFITTRITNEAQRKSKVREQLLGFLRNSGLNYVDLLQFHWPVPGFFLETWKEMENLQKEGYVKYLGVANCHEHHLEEIFKICKIRPVIGQFEIHPLFTQKPLIQYYKRQGIIVEAYTPLARFDDRLIRLPLLKKLAQKYNKSISSIILRWHVQNGVIPVVRCMNKVHQIENFQIFDFNLDDDEMKLIDNLNINSRLRYDPDNCDYSIL